MPTLQIGADVLMFTTLYLMLVGLCFSINYVTGSFNTVFSEKEKENNRARVASVPLQPANDGWIVHRYT